MAVYNWKMENEMAMAVMIFAMKPFTFLVSDSRSYFASTSSAVRVLFSNCAASFQTLMVFLSV
jgi:hypothetical protein